MHNTKLILLLKSFSSKDMKSLREFVRSPYFNKNKNVISLFDYLKKFHPRFDSEKLSDELVFRNVFGKDKFDYHKLKNISSDLLAAVKKFLVSEGIEEKTHLKNKILLEQYRSRSQDSLFKQLYKNVVSENESKTVKDEFYFYAMLDLSEELKSFYSPKEPNSHFELFQEQLDNLLEYALIRFLRLYNTMLHENKQNNFKYKFNMFDEVFNFIKNRDNQHNPTLLMYYYIILLETNGKEQYFFKLKELFESHYDEFSMYDKYMYYLHMGGFCADMYNFQCRTDFMKEHFLLSAENFEKGTIELGKIMYLDFMNYVKIAVRVNEFGWAEDYINCFKDKLTEEKDNTLNFCYAYIEFKKNNLDKALELFSRVNFSNFIVKIQLKLILLQIYYEKGFYELAINHIDSFRHYLKRESDIQDGFKDSFYNFLKIVNEMIRQKTNLNKDGNHFFSINIKNEITLVKTNHFGLKLWLFEKAEEFK